MTDIQDPVAIPNRSLTRRFGRGILLVLGTLLATTALVVLLSAVSMSVFDSAEQWQAWRVDNYWPFFTWRLMLYIALAIAWLTLKARLPQSRRKGLLKIEVKVVLLFAMVEMSKVLYQIGGAQ